VPGSGGYGAKVEEQCTGRAGGGVSLCCRWRGSGCKGDNKAPSPFLPASPFWAVNSS
jgi:hypothetical protein